MNDIVVFGHPSLTSKSENIINIDDYVVNLSKKMIDIMYAAPGVGLAAPQIGINKNIFVFDAGDGPKVAINPKLVKTEGSMDLQLFLELCRMAQNAGFVQVQIAGEHLPNSEGALPSANGIGTALDSDFMSVM